MQNVARLRAINIGQMATTTDRLLAFGRPRKLEDARYRPCLPPEIERTVIVGRRRSSRRSFGPAAVLAAMLGLASLIALGVGTSDAHTIHTAHQP